MSVNSVSSTQAGEVYSSYTNQTTKAAETNSKDKAVEAVTYEKGTTGSKATYSVNKMSVADRSALVEQLKADQASRKQSMVDLVSKMMGQQAKAHSIATDDDAMWKFLASGNFTVDEETKKQAQEDISEDGYWGVKETSQRLFDFASALAGDDVDKMKEMQKAMEKGFGQATKAWGKELPEISGQTKDAANKLFEEYYKEKGVN